jgi:hypothetical protein
MRRWVTGPAKLAGPSRSGRRADARGKRGLQEDLKGNGPRRKRAGKEAVAGCGESLVGRLASSFLFPISISFLKQANKFEFKPGFESKHPKTTHRHECNTHNYLFNLEKSNKGFFSILYSL